MIDFIVPTTTDASTKQSVLETPSDALKQKSSKLKVEISIKDLDCIKDMIEKVADLIKDSDRSHGKV